MKGISKKNSLKKSGFNKRILSNFSTIFQFEWKKLLRNRLVTAACLIMLAFYLVIVIFYSSKWTKEEKEIQKAVSGRVLDDELLGELKETLYSKDKDSGRLFIEDGANPYSALSYYVGNIFRKNYADLDSLAFYGTIDEKMDKTMREDELCSDGEIDFWEEQKRNIERPFVWYNADNFEQMRGAFSTYGIMGVMFAALCLSQIFAREYRQNRTGQMVFCTANGRSTVYFARLLAGCAFCVGYTAVILAVVLLTSFLLYGTEGLHGAIQLIAPYTPMALDFLGLIRIYAGLILVTSLFYAVAACVLSQLLKNSVAVMGVMTGVSLLLYALIPHVPEDNRILSQIIYYQPITVLEDFFYEFRTVCIGGHYFPVYQAAPAIYLMIAGALVSAGLKSYLNFQVKN